MAEMRYVLALGMFDGLHIGHRSILERAKEIAVRNRAKLIATTFSDEIKKKHIKNDGFLYPEGTRAEMLKNYGADRVVVFPANEVFLNQESLQFLNELNANYRPIAIVTGEDFTFGKDGAGNVKTLKEFFENRCEVIALPLKEKDDIKISTSRIKDALKNGKIESANALLSEPYSISGRVISGRREGGKNGVPTANLEVPECLAALKDGVYETKTRVSNCIYLSITNVGTHPTFGDYRRNIETFILDFDGNLYEKEIKIYFFKRLRDVREFPTEDALYRQIQSDIEEVRNDEIRRGR